MEEEQSVLWRPSILMEDVVLHYRPGSAAGVSVLVERTERLLEAFPCRPTPVFTPWFPSAAGCPLPIRPARLPPVISGWSEGCTGQSGPGQPGESCAGKSSGAAKLQHEEPQEVPNVLPSKGEPQANRTPSNRLAVSVTAAPVRRSWSVFKQRGVLLRRSPSTLSKHFHHMLSVQSLHLQQRVKWVIAQHNCGTSRDIEQVGRHFVSHTTAVVIQIALVFFCSDQYGGITCKFVTCDSSLQRLLHIFNSVANLTMTLTKPGNFSTPRSDFSLWYF